MILKKSLKSKISGQSTVEYIIISVGMAIIFFMGFVDFFGHSDNPLCLFDLIKVSADSVLSDSYGRIQNLPTVIP